MDVLAQIEDDYKTALKSKNELAILVFRQLKTAINNAEIANNREAINEEALIKLLRSEVKKRKESLALYEKGGRAELAKKELAEIEIIKKYLPEDLGEGVIKDKINQVISEVGADGPQDTGKIMGAVMKELGGQVDGSLVSSLVAEILKQK